MSYFENKVVWITGASSGIGESLAYAFANQGAKLVLSARRLAELERVKGRCVNPSRVLLVPLDLSQGEGMDQMVQTVLQHFQTIDILVSNGGISQRSQARDTSMKVYRDIMEVNFFGTIHLSNLVMQHFLEKNAGHLVAISSITGKLGLPLRTAYTASKHAIEGFYASLRTELWKTNIKILVVRPASIKTDIAKHALTGDGSAFNKSDEIIDKGISPDELANDILQAIEKNRQGLTAGPGAQKFVLGLHRFFPKMVFNLVKKMWR